MVLSPTASNQGLQPGITGLTVHVAAVLDPSVGDTGVLDTAKTGYLGYAVVDDAAEVPDTDTNDDAEPIATASVIAAQTDS